MCLLTYLPAGVLPDLTALHHGAMNNPDGHGYAVVAAGELIVGKSLDRELALAEFDGVRRAHPDGPAMFHSRLATHGRCDLDNCHPFAVGGDPRTVIAHNGVLPADVRPRGREPRSDTRIAAEDYLGAHGPLHYRHVRRQLERWMGPRNLMVLLTVDPDYPFQAYVFNEASGYWDDGSWYSNRTYLPDYGWLSTATGWDDVDLDLDLVELGARYRDRVEEALRCASCGCIPDLLEEWCAQCEHCWACGEPPERCGCWPGQH